MSKYHVNNGPFTVKQIAEHIGCEFVGDGDKQISGINAIQEAKNSELAFLGNTKYAKYLETTNAGAVILKKEFAEKLKDATTAIFSDIPHPDYARISNMFYVDKSQKEDISSNAHIHETAKIGENVVIQAGVYISEGVEIANNVRIEANTYLGKFVEIGEGTIIKSNASIECSKIGKECLIHAGAKIGQDGFGFAFDPTQMEIIKVPQVGGVIIGDLVEIGANTTIDRGSLVDTEIGSMTKIDNLVQIGHNVKIGKMCQIVSQTGIAGSSEIGNGCILGGQSGVAGHIKVADMVMLASRGAISKTVMEVGAVLGGTPAVPIKEWRKGIAILSRLVKQQSKADKGDKK